MTQRLDSGRWKQNAPALKARREARFLQPSLEFGPQHYSNSANMIEQQLEDDTSICVSYK